MKLRRAGGIAAAASALLTLALTATAGATPSRYVFEMCDSKLPGGGTAGVAYSHDAQPWAPANTCAHPGGSLAITQTGPIASGGSATWALPIEPPPGGRMESISVSARLCAQPGTIAWVIARGWPSPHCVDENRVFRLNADSRDFQVELRCQQSCAAGASVRGQYFATTISDPVPPTVGELGGTMLNGNVQRGRQRISAVAGDVGGGLTELSLLVNGLPAARPKLAICAVAQVSNRSVHGTVAFQITPCPTEAAAEWTLNTATYPFRTGTNTVTVCASDFATLGDPQSTCAPPRRFEVDDTCVESPVPGGDQLSVAFSESNDDAVTVAYGKGATLRGKLTTNAGDPIRGATLCVKMATTGIDPVAAPVDAVQTDSTGRFSYPVVPGPNREIVIGYRHDANQVARESRFFSKVRPRFKVNRKRVRNRQRVRFKGRLPGPNRAGRVVVLQANTVGSRRWITFRRATANRRGVFRTAYRFNSTTRRTKYRFRAVVPRQAGYPWVEGASRPVRVLVRP